MMRRYMTRDHASTPLSVTVAARQRALPRTPHDDARASAEAAACAQPNGQVCELLLDAEVSDDVVA